MKIKFTLVDYAIIILVICAIIFAFVHITSNDDSVSEKTSYDSSTLNKIAEKYLTYYRQGYIVDTTVNGYNATDGKPVTLTGNIKWLDDDRGSNVKALVNSNGSDYIVGLYNHVPNADVYINSMTLEMNGDKYSNLTEIKVNPKNITSLNDLVSGISNDTDYEITTTITLDSMEGTKMQEITRFLQKPGNYQASKIPSSRQVCPMALMICAVQLDLASSFLNLFLRYQPMKNIRVIHARKNRMLGKERTAASTPAQLILFRLVSRLPRMKPKPVICIGRKGLFSHRRSFFAIPSTSFHATLQQPASTESTAPIRNKGESKRLAMITMLMPKLRTGIASTRASATVKPSIRETSRIFWCYYSMKKSAIPWTKSIRFLKQRGAIFRFFPHCTQSD